MPEASFRCPAIDEQMYRTTELVLLQVSYLTIFHRGSLGFGEEALQSLPGNIGSQVLNCFSFRVLNFHVAVLSIYCSSLPKQVQKYIMTFFFFYEDESWSVSYAGCQWCTQCYWSCHRLGTCQSIKDCSAWWFTWWLSDNPLDWPGTTSPHALTFEILYIHFYKEFFYLFILAS